MCKVLEIFDVPLKARLYPPQFGESCISNIRGLHPPPSIRNHTDIEYVFEIPIDDEYGTEI